ncbi:hypothetical protein UA08_04544 [Talaromyces atroroseus]|uniref:Histone-lysine N-methyltransferase, H3 lysine-9 specific n=1 Tax=Talaromyces atroroseus TaxID=1441469 RepID=A0A225AY49_TALAT|nr:hypothetical protein UA08_04544 [Talaromyces atroroseus]OKL59896.1 hypothetical protein UA08_04544 [Talaromyces atroroseus]
MFVDLTRDDEDEDEDEVIEAQALLKKFTNSKTSIGESRSLKRKLNGATPSVDIKSNGVDNTNTNTHTHGQPVKPWPSITAAASPLLKVKAESRSGTPAYSSSPFTQSLPRNPVQAQLSFPKITPQFDSTYVSSVSESERSISRDQSIKRQTRSPSTFSSSNRPSNVMVVVPPPPTAASPNGLLKHKAAQKINRLPSVSSESAEESDPDEPKGTKSKYYPLQMYAIQAEKGRYPQARSTRREAITLPIRPRSHPKVLKSQGKARHSHKMYLRALLEKKLRLIQGPPVTMAADWDGTGSLASNFEFTNSYKLAQGVTRVPEEFNGGCPCGLQCDPQKCKCLSKEEDSEELMVPYEYRNGKLVLKESFIHKKTMIYECSSHCSCTKTCWNRLVQHGRSIRLEIFHTGSRGFGLRSPDYIHRGQFIDTYLGEVITSAEAELREDASSSQTNPSYLFSLDWFPASTNDDDDDNDADDDDQQDYYVVDGQRFGGPSRFMNHSCNPNCKIFPVSTHHGDERIYDLAFFALRDIPPGIEFTFDYNPHLTGEISHDPSAVKCLCGEAQCRGQLWPNQRKSSNI